MPLAVRACDLEYARCNGGPAYCDERIDSAMQALWAPRVRLHEVKYWMAVKMILASEKAKAVS